MHVTHHGCAVTDWSVSPEASCDSDDSSPDNRLEWLAEDRDSDTSKPLPMDDEGNRSFKLTSDDDTVSFVGMASESTLRLWQSESLSDVNTLFSPLHNTTLSDSCFPTITQQMLTNLTARQTCKAKLG